MWQKLFVKYGAELSQDMALLAVLYAYNSGEGPVDSSTSSGNFPFSIQLSGARLLYPEMVLRYYPQFVLY